MKNVIHGAPPMHRLSKHPTPTKSARYLGNPYGLDAIEDGVLGPKVEREPPMRDTPNARGPLPRRDIVNKAHSVAASEPVAGLGAQFSGVLDR